MYHPKRARIRIGTALNFKRKGLPFKILPTISRILIVPLELCRASGGQTGCIRNKFYLSDTLIGACALKIITDNYGVLAIIFNVYGMPF
ncbi:hypothetical protein A4308_12175 [Enterobacter sp. ODB01]|nr:hypothetical protein A4308_12175 [Enterobacter sp. ODB01]